MLAEKRFACAPATALSSLYLIPRVGVVSTLCRICAARFAPTPMSLSILIRPAARSSSRCRSPALVIWTARRRCRFRQTYDPTCSCRRRGQSWASALAPAEAKLGHEDKSDILVTPEKAAELSRPKADVKSTDPKAKPVKGLAGKTPLPGASPTPAPNAVDDLDAEQTPTGLTWC